MIDDLDTYAAPGRAFKPAVWIPNIPVVAYEPRPPRVEEVVSPTILMAGAWTFTMRKVLKLKVTAAQSRLAYAVNKDVLLNAIDILRDKEIPPAAWLAWSAMKRTSRATTPLAMAVILSADRLKEGRFRGWFRKETRGLFGGRAVIVGDPPGQDESEFAIAAYTAWATVEKARLEASWQAASIRGTLFPNADMSYLQEKR